VNLGFVGVFAFTIELMVTFSSTYAFDHGIFPSRVSFGSETPTLLKSFSTVGSNGGSLRFCIMFQLIFATKSP
jgi:hypothetical protein